MENPDEPPDRLVIDRYNQAILAAMMEELGSNRLNDLSLDDKPKASRKVNGPVNQAFQPNRPKQVNRLANQNKPEISAWQSFKPEDVDEADLLLDDLGGGQSHRVRMQAELSTNHRGQSSRGGRGGRAGGMFRGGAHVGQSSFRNEKLPALSLMSHGSRGAKVSAENIEGLLRNNGNPGRLVPAVGGQPRGNASSHGMPASARGNTSFPRRGSEARMVQTDGRVPRAPIPTQLMSLATPASFFGASDTAKNKSPVTVIAPVGSTSQTAETVLGPVVNATLSSSTGETSELEIKLPIISGPQEDYLISLDDDITTVPDMGASNNMEDMWTLKDDEKTVELIVESTIRGMTEKADRLAAFMEQIARGIVPEGRGMDSSVFASRVPIITREAINEYWESQGKLFRDGLRNAPIRHIFDQAATEIVRGVESSSGRRTRNRKAKLAAVANESNPIATPAEDSLASRNISEEANKPQGSSLKYERSELLKLKDTAPPVIDRNALPQEIRSSDYVKSDKVFTTKTGKVVQGLSASRWADKPSISKVSSTQADIAPAGGTFALKAPAPPARRVFGLADSKYADGPGTGSTVASKAPAPPSRRVGGLADSKYADVPDAGSSIPSKVPAPPARRVLGLGDSKYAEGPDTGNTVASKAPAPPSRRVGGLADSKYADVPDAGSSIPSRVPAPPARRVLGLADSKYADVPDGGSTITSKVSAPSTSRVHGLSDSKYADVPRGGEASDLIPTAKVQFDNTIDAPSANRGNTGISCQTNDRVQTSTDIGSVQPNNSRRVGGIDCSRWADPPATKELIPVLSIQDRLATSSLLGRARFTRYSVDGIEVDPIRIISSRGSGSASLSHPDRTRPIIDKETVSRVINPTLTYEDRKERRKNSLHQLTEATKRRNSLVQGKPIKGPLVEPLAEVGAIDDTTVPQVASPSTAIDKKDTASPKLAPVVNAAKGAIPAAESGKYDVKADNSSDPKQQLPVIQTVTIGAVQAKDPQKKHAGRCASLSTLQITRGINSSKYASDGDDISNSPTPGGINSSSRRLNANSATFKVAPGTRSSVSGIFNTNTQSNIVGTISPVAFSPQANTGSAMLRYVAFSPPAAPAATQPPLMLWAMVGVPNPARMGSVKTVEGVLMSVPHEDPSAPGTILAWVTIPNETTPGRMQSVEAALMAPPYDINNNRYHSELFPGWGGGNFAGNFAVLQHPQPIALASQENYHPGGYQSIATAFPQLSPQQTFVKIAPPTRVTIRSPLSNKPKNSQ